MKRALGVLLFLLWSPWALAVAPISGDRVAGGNGAQARLWQGGGNDS